MIKTINDWASSYEDLFYSKVSGVESGEPKIEKALDPAEQPMLWGKWVDMNTKGIEGAPPFGAKATTLAASFPPVLLTSPGTPSLAAQIITANWVAYINSVIWTPPPPVPPFSAITLVTTSPVGLVAAQASLLAALTAAFSAPAVAGSDKIIATQIATAFYTATLSVGIQLTGLTLPTPVPAPLIVPLSPVL